MATLVRWDPFREIAALQNEMSRFAGMYRDANGTSDRTWVPPLDVWETDDEVVYAFDFPGVPEDKITVEFEAGVLTVSAERGEAGRLLPLRATRRQLRPVDLSARGRD